MNCSGCGTELQAPPPTAGVEKSTKAGFWIRALARLIDFLFIMLLSFAVGIFCGLILYFLSASGFIAPGWQHRMRGFSILAMGFSLLGNILYHFFCEGIHGSTLGKLCCGIRVVRVDGRPSNFKGALIRTLAFYLDGLFFGLVALSSMEKSPLNQRYGDVWGKTAVLKTTEIAPESQRTTNDFLLGLFLGGGCLVAMSALGLILRAL